MNARPLIDYLSNLTVTQGRHAGQPFNVLPWQSRFVRGAFAPNGASSASSVGVGTERLPLWRGSGPRRWTDR